MLSDGSVVALNEATQRQILETVDAMSSRALRCLAFAQKLELDSLARYDGDSHPVGPRHCLISVGNEACLIQLRPQHAALCQVGMPLNVLILHAVPGMNLSRQAASS